MKKSFSELPFKIAAPSMVFGKDLIENVLILAQIVDSVEIVIFFTTDLNNIPTREEIQELKRIAEQYDITYTIHLPAYLEIASSDKNKRNESVHLANEICLKTEELEPTYYILHIPFSPPTLVPVPGLYFKSGEKIKWDEWTARGLASLESIDSATRQNGKFLVENINYSPLFLEPFWREGFCGLCLDLGHLLLGNENVNTILRSYSNVTREIHLHGVKGYEEHISLSVLPKYQVHEWLRYLIEVSFKGVLNLEVFSPQDLNESLNIAYDAYGLGTPFKNITER
ncbi:MAG: TIM barrel protein [Deltaproteobacteria bacterium]|nr:TIM barrel protein [Deltaproteobacteria bacterium]